MQRRRIMRKLACLTFVVLCASLLISCVAPPAIPLAAVATPAPTTVKMINPGDKIGDFLVTTGNPGEVVYTWGLGCVKQSNEEKYACTSTVGEKVNVSVGVFAALSAKSLDTLWTEHTYELFIDGRPVNLAAFGSIDTTHPKVGKMRHWNVVLVAAKPGEISVRDSGTVDGDHFGGINSYTFNAP
jgi:hypothetical protein